jgi:hypothetical protein
VHSTPSHLTTPFPYVQILKKEAPLKLLRKGTSITHGETVSSNSGNNNTNNNRTLTNNFNFKG